MKTKVFIEGNNTDGFTAYIADEGAPYGLIGEGNTLEETKTDFFSAYQEMRGLYQTQERKFCDLDFEFLPAPPFHEHPETP